MSRPNASKRRRLALRRKQKKRRERDADVTREFGKAGHRMCGRKVRFSDEHSARSRAEYRMAMGVPMLNVYHCPYCDGWHLTSH